jgi:anion-transporting  ArsA/GET3 family ATPase
MASQVMLRTISKVVGGAVVADAMAFFTAFEGMEQGFRDRAAKVQQLLADPQTAFVVIAAPRRDAVEEAIFFADRLRQSSGRVEALVVNRMFPYFGPVPEGLDPGLPAAPAIDALLTNLRDLDNVATREEQHVEALAGRLPGAPIIRVPFLSDDIHDLGGLAAVGRWLFDTGPKATWPSAAR